MNVTPLKMLRKESRLTQQELSAKSSVDVSYISQLETRAQKNISMRTAWRLARVLSEELGRPITPTELFPEELMGSNDSATYSDPQPSSTAQLVRVIAEEYGLDPMEVARKTRARLNQRGLTKEGEEL